MYYWPLAGWPVPVRCARPRWENVLDRHRKRVPEQKLPLQCTVSGRMASPRWSMPGRTRTLGNSTAKRADSSSAWRNPVAGKSERQRVRVATNDDEKHTSAVADDGKVGANAQSRTWGNGTKSSSAKHQQAPVAANNGTSERDHARAG